MLFHTTTTIFAVHSTQEHRSNAAIPALSSQTVVLCNRELGTTRAALARLRRPNSEPSACAAPSPPSLRTLSLQATPRRSSKSMFRLSDFALHPTNLPQREARKQQRKHRTTTREARLSGVLLYRVRSGSSAPRTPRHLVDTPLQSTARHQNARTRECPQPPLLFLVECTRLAVTVLRGASAGGGQQLSCMLAVANTSPAGDPLSARGGGEWFTLGGRETLRDELLPPVYVQPGRRSAADTCGPVRGSFGFACTTQWEWKRRGRRHTGTRKTRLPFGYRRCGCGVVGHELRAAACR